MSTWFVAVAYVAVIYAASYCAAPHAWLNREHPTVIKARCLAVMVMGIGCLVLSKGWLWTVHVAEMVRTFFLLLSLIYLRWANSDTGTPPSKAYARLKAAAQARSYLSQVMHWSMARDLFVVAP